MTQLGAFRSAFVPHDLEQPLAGAGGGPLAGLTAAVKDMFDVAGERVGGGSPAWLAAQEPARTHSAAVAALLEAGATIVGKTVCDEFFYSVIGANAHYGTPLNPRAPDRIPGGSSSGSASACSAGACDVALGSDTAGSVRVPAALCGVYGIRATHGRIDLRGAMRMAPTFDSGGWFAASAGLLRRVGPVLLREWAGEAGDVARVALLEDAFAHAEADVAALCRGFLRGASGALPELRAQRLAGDAIDDWREAMRITQAHEVWESFGAFLSAGDPELGPGVAERMRIAATIGEAEVERSRAVLAEATRRVEEATAERTVLALPTTPAIAPLLGAPAAELEAFRVDTMRLVCLASISGLPQVTVPIGSVAGAPVGLSFIGWRDGDEALLALAQRISPFVGCRLA